MPRWFPLNYHWEPATIWWSPDLHGYDVRDRWNMTRRAPTHFTLEAARVEHARLCAEWDSGEMSKRLQKQGIRRNPDGSSFEGVPPIGPDAKWYAGPPIQQEERPAFNPERAAAAICGLLVTLPEGL